jgi:hypothetical protein
MSDHPTVVRPKNDQPTSVQMLDAAIVAGARWREAKRQLPVQDPRQKGGRLAVQASLATYRAEPNAMQSERCYLEA